MIILDKKKPQTLINKGFTVNSLDVRERIRTPDTLVRSQVLYPAELHTHTICFSHNIFYYTFFSSNVKKKMNCRRPESNRYDVATTGF